MYRSGQAIQLSNDHRLDRMDEKVKQLSYFMVSLNKWYAGTG